MTTSSGLPNEFNQSVAVVTGAAQGIGAHVVQALHHRGAQVVGLDIQYPPILAPCKFGWRRGVDVSDASQVQDAINQIEETVGAIDYCVSAAGILHLQDLLQTSAKHWQRTFDVNTHGTFNICRNVCQKMQMRQAGSLVAVSSNAASTARKTMGAYAASKAAVTQLIRCLALEMAQYNVRCNLVAPGSTDTPMQRQLWDDESGEQNAIAGNLEQFRLGIPLKRIATPEAVTNTILFLLSHQSAHITMETITVDGGATLGLL